VNPARGRFYLITPEDIQKKTFAKGVRGYKEDEVDSFLDLITLDMDKLTQENIAMRETIRLLNAEVERYRGSESTIFDTLESAKALMSDISFSAERRAEIVLKNAELDAERIQREARESVERITEEGVLMAKRWEQFKLRYKNLLQNELDRFETLSEELLAPGSLERQRFYSDDAEAEKPRRILPKSGAEKADASNNVNKTVKTVKRNGL
jgi:cell division initiation protein